MSSQVKLIAGTALLASLGLGLTQSATASPLPPQINGELISQTTTTGTTQVPARINTVSANGDFVSVELLTTGETRQLELSNVTEFEEIRQLTPGSYAIFTFDEANNVIAVESVTEEEAIALSTELETDTTEQTTTSETSSETIVESETTVESQRTVQQQPTTQAQPTQPVRALW